jgi:hypothetical protein
VSAEGVTLAIGSIASGTTEEGSGHAEGAVPSPVSVLLVTQIRLYAEGIAAALDDSGSIGRVAVEQCCETALVRLARDPTDVVVLDLAGIDDVAAAQAFVHATARCEMAAMAAEGRRGLTHPPVCGCVGGDGDRWVGSSAPRVRSAHTEWCLARCRPRT